jgi:polyhydroxybutyrate depolymerase
VRLTGSAGSAVGEDLVDHRRLGDAGNGLGAVTPTTAVIDSSPADAGPANRFDYAGPTPVQWWRLDGAGHTTPSRTVLTAPNSTTGTQSRDIEFAEIVWAFFKARMP